MSRLAIIYLLGILLLFTFSCQKKDLESADPELENLRGSLAIKGLTIFGYENNQLSYQLKSRYMVRSLDKNQLEFSDFVMQKIDSQGVNGLYLANKLTYTFDKNQAALEQANLENYHDQVVLSADNLLIDYVSNTLTGNHAQIKRPNQQISGKKIFYDLISGRIEFAENVEGYYEEGTGK